MDNMQKKNTFYRAFYFITTLATSQPLFKSVVLQTLLCQLKCYKVKKLDCTSEKG